MKRGIILLSNWLRCCLVLILLLFNGLCFAGSQTVGTFYTGDTKIINFPQSIWGNGNKVMGATSSRTDLVEIVEQTTTSATIRVKKAVAGETVRVGITVDYTDAKLNYKRESYLFTLYIKSIPIEMSQSSISLNVGEKYDLYYKSTIAGKSAPEALNWTSSDRSVATVTSNGRVCAEGGGTALISATTTDGETASCRVTVSNVDPTGVSLPTSLEVYENSSAYLDATLIPNYATTTFAWWSDDLNIAYVTGSGSRVVVTGRNAGETKVHVKTANGYEDYCKIKVLSTEPSSVSLDKSDLKLKYAGNAKLTATLSPSYAVSDVIWSSSDENVATVSGGEVQATGEGRATITATTKRGNRKATCNVSVGAKPTHFVLVLNSGERLAYLLENNPKVICNSETITVVDGIVQLELPLEDVHKYVLGVGTDFEIVNGDANTIQPIKSDDDGVIQQVSGALLFKGFTTGSNVAVYSINGTLIRKSSINETGHLEINISNYPQGIYIIKVQNKSIKITKR